MHLIVLYTNRHPGASQEEIASFYALDKGSVARDARRLEDMGHIRRETVPNNRRQYQLFLTEEGERMLPVLDQAFEEFQARLSASLSPEDWQLLTDLLERLEQGSFPHTAL
jgi:DNA-binding MarR family transcriptional regulator